MQPYLRIEPLIHAAWLAALLLVFLCRSLPAEESGKDKAKMHFDRAIGFFKEGKYKDALLDFEASYEYRPHWALKYNMVICHYYLKHDLKALELLTEYLEEGQGKIEKDQKAKADKFLKELKVKFGVLVLIGVKKDTSVKIDGMEKQKPTSKKEIFIEPGKHSVFVMTGGSVVIDKKMMFHPGEKVTLFAGVIENTKAAEPIVEKTGEEKETKVIGQKVEATAEEKGQEFEIAAAKPGSRLKTPALITLGIGAALLVGGAAAGGITLKEKSLKEQAEDDYMAGYYGSATNQELLALEESRNDHSSRAKQSFIASAVLLSAGGILAAASIVLFGVSLKREKKLKPEERSVLFITPWSLGVSLSL